MCSSRTGMTLGSFWSVLLLTACGYVVGPSTTETAIPATATRLEGLLSPSPPPSWTATSSPTEGTPLGGWIAYSSSFGGPDLHMISADGTRQAAMGLEFLQPESPAWSPDTRMIVFNGVRVGGLQGIYAVQSDCVNVSGDCARVVVKISQAAGQYASPAWSREGELIAYMYRPTADPGAAFEIWTMRVDGTAPIQLTEIGGFDPSWSPDGHTIAFESHVVGEEWGVTAGETLCGRCGNIFVMGLDGSMPRRLTHALPDTSQPAWSPLGNEMAVVSAEGHDLAEPGTNTFIFILTPDGEIVSRLIDGSWPAWSPDGLRIVFVREGSSPGLYVINADGSGLFRLSGQVGDTAPAWSP